MFQCDNGFGNQLPVPVCLRVGPLPSAPLALLNALKCSTGQISHETGRNGRLLAEVLDAREARDRKVLALPQLGGHLSEPAGFEGDVVLRGLRHRTPGVRRSLGEPGSIQALDQGPFAAGLRTKLSDARRHRLGVTGSLAKIMQIIEQTHGAVVLFGLPGGDRCLDLPP